MFEQQELIDQFTCLLNQQKSTEKYYEKTADNFTNPKIKSQLDHIIKQQKRHIQLTRRLLEIVD